MKLEHLSIATGVMRKGMTLRDFFEECVRCNVPGLPYVDGQDRIIGRISIRDVYKHMAIPDSVIQVAHLLGDQTDQLDLPEMKVSETLDLPVETYLLENIPGVSPRSSIACCCASRSRNQSMNRPRQVTSGTIPAFPMMNEASTAT
jgi:hypothetical protein